MKFEQFFKQATGNCPYDYQSRLARANPWPDVLEAPTGVGKTEAVVLAWLWRRRYHLPESTPRRLVYCLPMRVLVEQTHQRVKEWLSNLGLSNQVGVHLLMGGEDDDDWDMYPERDAILIGTQDMLLSRALNRGYALSRYRWPVQFGLLNNDCLWVYDEVQLMGSGLATTAQLAAFRERFGVWGRCPSLWVSATLQPEWLATVDFRDRVNSGLTVHRLEDSDWKDPRLAKRLNAKKVLRKARYTAEQPDRLAQEIYEVHKQTGGLTLVVLNTVRKAVAVYEALKQLNKSDTPLLLLHSRFRSPDRQAKMQRLWQMQETGGIVVTTQVIEAGVDISARVLFTELSPWVSFVQRVGRCNRKGEFEEAQVFWIDVDTAKKSNAEPYKAAELDAVRAELNNPIKDVGLRDLHNYLVTLSTSHQQVLYPYEVAHVIRRRTAEELFDTTPDLTDADIDISLYIREDDEHDVQVFWRAWSGDDPNQPQPQPAPARDELCPAALTRETRDWLKKQSCWRWSFLEGRWQRADNIVPGQIYLLPANAGGYSPEKGFDPRAKAVVGVLGIPGQAPEGNDDDPYSSERKVWQTIAAHTNQVVEELERILTTLGALFAEGEVAELRRAARWHDWGKASEVFQKALTAKATPDFPLPDEFHRWGKSGGRSERYVRPGFRHELASALGMLTLGHSDLSCYLVAAHHGKVRVSIRSLPNEKPAPGGRRVARGVWEGDSLPQVKLGGGVIAPAVTLSLAPMELGLGANGQPSWAERVLNLVEAYGPYRLAYLEALLCAADRRASANPCPEVPND